MRRVAVLTIAVLSVALVAAGFAQTNAAPKLTVIYVSASS
jgi:hypothetical protein